MDTTWSSFGDRSDWECLDCSRTNTYSDYRCPGCKQRKPYLREGMTGESSLKFPVDVYRLVLLGKTCNGKSSTGNTLLGVPGVFVEGEGIGATTGHCQMHNAVRFNITLKVVDTPGLFDPEVDNATLTREIYKCVGMLFPGPHAVLIVLRADVAFTKEESDAVSHLRSVFGDDIMNHVIVVFTHCDSVERLRPRLERAPSSLKKLLEDTENRYVVINNKEEDGQKKEEQVKRLLITVRGLLASNGDRPFVHPLVHRIRDTVDFTSSQLASVLGENLDGGKAIELIGALLEKKENAECMVNELLVFQTSQASRAGRAEQHAKELEDTLSRIEQENAKLQNELQRRRGIRCTVL